MADKVAQQEHSNNNCYASSYIYIYIYKEREREKEKEREREREIKDIANEIAVEKPLKFAKEIIGRLFQLRTSVETKNVH